ncbi:hypothetical protein GCM10017673_31140 [Streptosporangium violaceochromogenes]|nr:hypothetical protein GCM10017673_31140 [Streptosporangium violaceochromogenes]
MLRGIGGGGGETAGVDSPRRFRGPSRGRDRSAVRTVRAHEGRALPGPAAAVHRFRRQTRRNARNGRVTMGRECRRSSALLSSGPKGEARGREEGAGKGMDRSAEPLPPL